MHVPNLLTTDEYMYIWFNHSLRWFSALWNCSLLLCLNMNWRLSVALYAKIENTNTNSKVSIVQRQSYTNYVINTVTKYRKSIIGVKICTWSIHGIRESYLYTHTQLSSWRVQFPRIWYSYHLLHRIFVKFSTDTNSIIRSITITNTFLPEKPPWFLAIRNDDLIFIVGSFLIVGAYTTQQRTLVSLLNPVVTIRPFSIVSFMFYFRKNYVCVAQSPNRHQSFLIAALISICSNFTFFALDGMNGVWTAF